MGEYEDAVYDAIKAKFGSVPKMAESTGLAPTTIYHALDRGLQNTNTKTSKRIIQAVFGDEPLALYGVVDLKAPELSSDEQELLDVYRSVGQRDRELILNHARMVREHVNGKGQS